VHAQVEPPQVETVPVRTVAIVPARGGSKGVPRKNVRPVGGVPLVVRTVRAAQLAAGVDLVVVSTDDAEIAALAADAGARVVDRPAALAGDTATSESALLHALDVLAADGVRPETVVFLQCTSPFVDPAAIDAGVELVRGGRADSVFSGLETYEFLWRADGTGDLLSVTGQNHDAGYRPRRQDRAPDYRETGAFYVLRADGLREHGHRFFGRTAVVPVSERSAIEIDTVAELEVADSIARAETATPDRLDVDALITDFDGVHTPDTCYLDANGLESVRVSRRDGMGVSRLRRTGVPLLILSTEQNPVVTRRAEKLQVEVAQGVDDKAAAVRRWCTEKGLAPARVAFVGNDVNDLAAMAVVGWPVAVADADPAVRRAARLVLTRDGGHGAVREVCDLILGRS
jgi:N-acylneuraminate cytidylyltransferase